MLDEPTATLTGDERAHLHEIISRFRADGGAVILVSHDLEEALALTDEVTVLRNGVVAARLVSSKTSQRELANAIIGQVPLREVTPTQHHQIGETRCVVSGLTSSRLDGVDLSLRAGEIVGVTGLAGSGFTDISSLLTGVDVASGGVLSLNGESHELRAMNPRLALRKGIGFLPGSRSLGCIGDLPVTDNITLGVIALRGTRFTLRRRELRARAQSMVEEYQVKTPRADLPQSTLSGGNQQKVLLARCLSTKPKLLLLDEPTAGVDVGARVEIFRILRRAASEGTAIVCASSDWEQLELLCNRVIVIRDGRVVAELPAPVTKSAIANACFATRGKTNELRGGDRDGSRD